MSKYIVAPHQRKYRKALVMYGTGPCGSGKTTTFLFPQVIDCLTHTVHGFHLLSKIVLATPTKRQLDEFMSKLTNELPQGSEVLTQIIHSDSRLNGKNVLADVVEFMQRPDQSRDDKSEILGITIQSMKQLPYPNLKDGYSLYLDEAPDPFDLIRLHPSNLRENLMRFIRLKFVGGNFSTFRRSKDWKNTNEERIRFCRRLEKIVTAESAKDKRLQNSKLLAECSRLKLVLNYVERQTKGWKRRVNRRLLVRTKDWSLRNNGTINIVSEWTRNVLGMACPQTKQHGWKQVTVLAALFHRTFLYKLRKKIEIHKLINSPSLCNDEVHNYHGEITFKYSDKVQLLSKRLLRETDFLKAFISASDADCRGSSYRYVTNPGFVDEIKKHLSEGSQGELLPGDSAGSNQFLNESRLVYLMALNPPPVLRDYFLWKGLSKDDIIEAFTYYKMYQDVCRICLRDPSSTKAVTIYLPTKKHAEWLKQFFPNAKLVEMDIEYEVKNKKRGRPKKYSANLTESQKRAARRREKKELDQFIADISAKRLPLKTTYHVQQFASIYQGVIWIPTSFYSLESFVGFLERKHRKHYPVKFHKDHHFISGASYKADGIHITRRNNNGEMSACNEHVRYLQFVILDFDMGGFEPKHIQSLFPNIAMVVCNSTGEGNKFRAFIFTDCFMPPDLYEYVVRSLRWLIEHNKTRKWSRPCDPRNPTKKEHGFDNQNINPCQKFLSPAQRRDPRQKSFFIYQQGEMLNVGSFLQQVRCPEIYLNMHRKILSSKPLSKPNQRSASTTTIYESYRAVLDELPIAMTDNVVTLVTDYQALSDGRDRGYWLLAVELDELGLDDAQIKACLDEAHKNHPRKDPSKAERVVKALRARRLRRRDPYVPLEESLVCS